MASLEAVGRWGEEMANRVLGTSRPDLTDLNWVNQDGETGLPYDLIAQLDGSQVFIEVKTSIASTADNVIHMSVQGKSRLARLWWWDDFSKSTLHCG